MRKQPPRGSTSVTTGTGLRPYPATEVSRAAGLPPLSQAVADTAVVVWLVVVLKADGEPDEAYGVFADADDAETWASTSPDARRYKVVPMRFATSGSQPRPAR